MSYLQLNINCATYTFEGTTTPPPTTTPTPTAPPPSTTPEGKLCCTEFVAQ